MGREVTFDELVASLPQRGMEWHRETLLLNSNRNAAYISRTIRDVPENTASTLVVSAGPSLYRQRSLSSLGAFQGTIVATDGAYIQCLKAGATPDFVVTLDPHPTRIVRWFGDPDFERNSHGDDYFSRQDLDVSFRQNAYQQNAENIRTVDENRVPLVICTASPENVVARTSGFRRFWFAPLVDSPAKAGSVTRAICEATGCPALNTGGTVGTAAWNFAHSILGSRNIAVVGMDFGYYLDTPLEQTQSWHMLGGNPEMYPRRAGYWGDAFIDPTYEFYRLAFLDLLKASGARIVNCTGGGTLMGAGIDCMEIEGWLRTVKH